VILCPWPITTEFLKGISVFFNQSIVNTRKNCAIGRELFASYERVHIRCYKCDIISKHTRFYELRANLTAVSSIYQYLKKIISVNTKRTGLETVLCLTPYTYVYVMTKEKMN
jgi:hypothetical protein